MEVAKDALKGNQGSTLCGKNEHRTFGSGSDAQTNKADWMSRALDIPKENSDADAKFVKVTLPLPMRWKKRDVLSRDPVPFLREVHNYALCSKQACSRMLGASLDGELRHAYELVTERLREENHAEVSWEQAVQVFKMLVGKDLCDPEHDAMIKITRGEIKQGKEETMFEYSVKFRHNVFAAPAIPVIIVCDKFVTGMYSPEMRKQCAHPFEGGNWFDLQKCIEYAMACEKRILGTSAYLNVTAASEPKANPNASAANVLGNAERLSGKKHFNRGRGRKPMQRGRGNHGGGGRSDGGGSTFNGCYSCGGDHLLKDCPNGSPMKRQRHHHNNNNNRGGGRGNGGRGGSWGNYNKGSY
jgi:hypothetical protein